MTLQTLQRKSGRIRERATREYVIRRIQLRERDTRTETAAEIRRAIREALTVDGDDGVTNAQ